MSQGQQAYLHIRQHHTEKGNNTT
uniref:Uncharacterized protein n=1 Tax=Arundo donax TaxID=35708 RepID=A0A0A8ZVV0_ARUDO